MYKLNIAKDVAIVGDFNNMNLTQMKQYVDFNINIDWIAIQTQAQSVAHSYFQTIIPGANGVILSHGSVVADYEDGNNYETYTEER